MKTLSFVFLLLVLAGCRSGPTFSGGDGSTMDEAVIIKRAYDDETLVSAERGWLAERYPGYEQRSEAQLSLHEKHYDIVNISTPKRDKTIYFDITDFMGK